MLKSSYSTPKPRRRGRKTSRKTSRKWNLAPFLIGFVVLCVLGYLYLSAHGPILIQLGW
jgi:hypothetical protein